MTVKSASRAVDIIDLLANHPEGLSMTEVGVHLGYPLSATHALILTLVERNFIFLDKDSRKYRLGSRIFQIANQYLGNFNIVDLARDPIRQLREICDETISLGLLEGDEIVLFHKNESSKALRTGNPLGKRLPIYCSAMGKSIMATWPEDQLMKYLDRTALIPFTPYTKTDPQEIIEDLSIVRQTGIAYDLQESTPGVCAIGVSIDEGKEKVTSTLAIVVPSLRAIGDTWEKLPDILSAGAEIIGQLSRGYSSPGIYDKLDKAAQGLEKGLFPVNI